MTSVYKETEYYMTDLGDKKVLLSIEDEFDIGTKTDLDGDLSGTEVVIYAENLLLSKEIKSKLLAIYAKTITTVGGNQAAKAGNEKKAVAFDAGVDLTVAPETLLEIYDNTNQKYLSINCVKSVSGTLLFEEKMNSGADNIDLSSFMFAHPTQCSMLLEKAKLLYRMGDPVVNKGDLDNAILLFTRLRDSLKIFNDLELSDDGKNDPPLATLYKQNEASIGAVNSISTFKSIYNTANGLLGQIKKGSDYYGNSYNYVPLASKEFYQAILEKQISNFQYIENNYFQFLDAERKEEDRLSDLKNAISYLSQVSEQANSEMQSLKERAASTEIEITNLESQFEAKRKVVDQRLEEFKDKITQSFNLNIQSILSSLTTLAFLSESPAAGLVIAGAGIGYDIDEAATTIKNDEGITVQKDYLVNKVVAFEGDMDSSALSEQAKKISDGEIVLDDPGADKLLAEEDAVNKFLSDYYVKFPDATKSLQQAFQDYVQLVLSRNNKVLYYNAVVTLIIKNHNIMKDVDQKKNIINEENLKLYKPGLPAFTTVMGSLYTSSQSQVMESLYLTERAFRFWSLSDEKPVTQVFSDNKVMAINTAVLKESQSSILSFYGQVVEDRKKIEPQDFPAQSLGKGSVFWQLSQDDVDTLKSGTNGQYMVLFPLHSARKDTNIDENPFAGYADIRLTKVYVWIDGVKTSDNKLNLTITHTGQENIINQSNSEFVFKHNSKNVPFKYEIGTTNILEGGTIGNSAKDSTYALVGPFTWWNITIVDHYNKNLDLSKVTSIKLEFQGNNYPFNQ